MAMTDDDRSTMVGIFEDEAMAERAVSELRSAGFGEDQVSLVVHSASVTDEDMFSEQRTGVGEHTAEEATDTYKGKSEVSRTIVAVKAEGREQEALGILHRNGANNANIPDVLEADLAPIVGSETDDTGRQKKQVTDAHSKDGLFDRPADADAPWRP